MFIMSFVISVYILLHFKDINIGQGQE